VTWAITWSRSLSRTRSTPPGARWNRTLLDEFPLVVVPDTKSQFTIRKDHEAIERPERVDLARPTPGAKEMDLPLHLGMRPRAARGR
jgi:hypothetical protein